MKGCRLFQGRSAGRYLKFSNWHYSTSASKPIAEIEDHKNVFSSSATADDLSWRKDGHDLQTTRIDEGSGEKDGSGKKIKPRELPLSPLMDPSFLEARNRHAAPKPPPKKEERTAFQAQLAKNPYGMTTLNSTCYLSTNHTTPALALATPVRQCSATLLSLPTFFLQDFTIMAHPTTSLPWHVPRSLAAHSSNLKTSDDKASSSHTPSLGASAYVAMRQPLLKSFIKKGTGNTGMYKKFGLMHAKSVARKHMVIRAVWRTDMDTFVLELLRKRIAELLAYLCKKDNRYVHECSSWEKVEYGAQIGCVLWMGQKMASGEEGAQEHEQEQETPPGEFETKRIGPGGRKVVPVFNLRTMMGKQWVEKMREGNGIFRNQILVVKHKNATKEIQMRLWKLQGYVATYGGMSIEKRSGKVPQAKGINFKSTDIARSKPKAGFKAFG
ncbi:hypothetical protein NHQ30_005764 [Ciborinia camelliae]|nr:hypothetical protein NHQ30_005764 [Ciborinia camelliae]